MNEKSGDSFKWQHDVLALLLIGLLSLLPFLGQTDDLVSREVRHAQIAREMATHGHFLVPTLLGEIYIDKPPVMHSLIALLYRLTGEHTMLLARLPSVIAAVAGAMVLYGIAITMYTRQTALLAGFGLLSMLGYVHMARAARPDMIYTLAILMACLGFVRVLRMSVCQTWQGLLLAGVATGVATICKGPLGLIFPLLFVVTVSFLTPQFRRLAVSEWLLFFLVFLLAISGWLVPAWLEDNGQYVSRVLSQPDLDPDPGKSEHFFGWYIPQLIAGLFPMVFLLPWLVKDVRQRGLHAMLLLGLLMVLVLSCIAKKRIHYLLPVFPFFAMAIADAVVQFGKIRFAVIFMACTLLGGPLYYAYQQSRSVSNEDWQFAIAREVTQKAGAKQYILCHGTVGEYIAFLAADNQVLPWDDEAGLREALVKAGGSAWVVFSTETQDIVKAISGIELQSSELLTHQKDSKKDDSLFYMRRVRVL